jgi:hypothetical protein
VGEQHLDAFARRRPWAGPIFFAASVSTSLVRASAVPSGQSDRYDFFLSRRGSVAAIAREVADVLTERGYRVRAE